MTGRATKVLRASREGERAGTRNEHLNCVLSKGMTSI